MMTLQNRNGFIQDNSRVHFKPGLQKSFVKLLENQQNQVNLTQ